MNIPVGFKQYVLRLTDGGIRLEGQRCASLCDHQRKEILVSSDVPEHLRMHVAAAAVAEAWAHEIGLLRTIPFIGDVR
jgi:hypothetical protein